jgi:hypothetical protein
MITQKVIDSLYKKYSKRPESPDKLPISMLFEYTSEQHALCTSECGEHLIIGSTEPSSPFHKLPIACINAIVNFEEWVAIVLHSSIIFLSKISPKINIHIKQPQYNFFDRILETVAVH